jgi:hypothetical protein
MRVRVLIHHKPDCGTSLIVLGTIQADQYTPS